jgi:HSP20 family protein
MVITTRWDPFRDLMSIQNELNRHFGSFTRSLSLPPTANPDGIEARFDNGVLTVEVPKADQAKPKKITVKASG